MSFNDEKSTPFLFLGVALDTELTYRVLYEDTINRANKPLGLILRMMRDFNDPKAISTIHASLARSILEFASIVWSPDVWIERIEALQ